MFAGLIAYLNGVIPTGGKSPLTGKPTEFRSVQTLFAKNLGMILSIPSGLCVGPEGPIIHIGALLAHHTTRLVHKYSRRCFDDEHHLSLSTRKGEERDFLATGAAVGVCVAFRAPLVRGNMRMPFALSSATEPFAAALTSDFDWTAGWVPFCG